MAILVLSSFAPHPYYLGVTDIKYNKQTQALELSVKLFTNDLETALSKLSKKPVDLINPKNKAETDTLVYRYVSARLQLRPDGKTLSYRYIGYEHESDAVWIYLESAKIARPKTLDLDNKLLYDFLPQQINIVHTDISGTRQSSKVTNPDYKMSFNF